MIYLPVQSHALCPVLSGVILSFNTKCLIMPHATLTLLLIALITTLFFCSGSNRNGLKMEERKSSLPLYFLQNNHFYH